jgi:hypothetical protein
MAILTLLLLWTFLCPVAPFSPGHTCGNDHPSMAAEVATPALVAPQAYHADDHRILQAQSYGGAPVSPAVCGSTTAWVPLTQLNARPIRITVVWDLVVNGDSGVCDDGTAGPCVYQCTNANSPGVMVKNAAGSAYSSSGFSCSASDAVGNILPTPSNLATVPINMAIMYARTTAAVNFWASTLQVVPVLDTIVIPTTGLSTSGLAVTNHVCPSGSTTSCSALRHNNTDLVVIMTARPSPNSPIAGYALCLQSDQWGRCTVGQFNWVPSGLDRTGYLADSESSKESELHTAMHELVHVFGGMGPGYTQPTSNFVNNSNGCRQPTDSVLKVVADDPAFPAGSSKPVTYIVTPKVAALTRYYYNCSSAVGFPLEDVPLGKGAHWEARVAGSELMSYGANTGQIYLSDLTLAYLEDTQRYIANYSNAGFIVVSTFNAQGVSSPAQPFLGASGLPYVPPSPIAPGTPRWGYMAGCAWLGQSNTTTTAPPPLSVAMPAPYTCTTHNVQTCSADHRLSAVCVVQASYTTVTNTPSWGQFNQLPDPAPPGVTAGPVAISTPGASTGFVNTLPPWAQFFDDAGAKAATLGQVPTAAAVNTGGYNDAMDYMPVPVGELCVCVCVVGALSLHCARAASLTLLSTPFLLSLPRLLELRLPDCWQQCQWRRGEQL